MNYNVNFCCQISIQALHTLIQSLRACILFQHTILIYDVIVVEIYIYICVLNNKFLGAVYILISV